jgi:Tol biopolymer transport system component
MRSRLTAVLASLSLCVLFSAQSAEATFPGHNGKVAFSGFGGSPLNNVIYAIEPDGTGQQEIVRPGLSPSWSPDGRRVAFGGFPPNGIEVTNPDGTGRVVLTRPPGIIGAHFEPDWAPDGALIAFSESFRVDDLGNTGSALRVVGSDGSGVRYLLFGNSSPAWSPDGLRLAYADYTTRLEENEDGDLVEVRDSGIKTSNLDGTAMVQLTSGPHFDHSPDWSPDGSQVVFQRSGVGLYVVNADGSGLRFLAPGASPSWSPDGSQITFARGAPCPNSEIYTINVDGSGERQVTSPGDGICAQDPDWQRLLGPRRSDYKNASKFCKAEREFFGEEAFRQRYGGGANAYGKCVSRN